MYDSLLELIDAPFVSQQIHLVAAGIIKSGEDEDTGAAYLEESFADLAFRLRDEIMQIEKDAQYTLHPHKGLWLDALCEVIEYCEGRTYCKECHQKHSTKKLFSWGDHAQPIHWIVAALIAKEMAKEEMREH